jgi:hypothetical protein
MMKKSTTVCMNIPNFISAPPTATLKPWISNPLKSSHKRHYDIVY